MNFSTRFRLLAIFECINIGKFRLLLFSPLMFLSFSINAQNYTTTGVSNDWNDPAAWDCTGGPCNNNPVPNKNLSNSVITINHNLTYDANQPINLGDRSTIYINRNATLNITSNLNIDEGGKLIIDNGEINIGPGVLNNMGMIDMNKAVFTKDGNVVNDSEIVITNSCFVLTSGNFVNNASLIGDGNVKVESGNIDNGGTWGNEIDYYAANNNNVNSGTELTEIEINEICDCITVNCDIIPGIPPGTKFDGIIGFELNRLFLNHVPGENLNPIIYTINNDNEVLIEIIVTNGQYNNVINFLSTEGISSSDFIEDSYDSSLDENMITLFYPIDRLGVLNLQDTIINAVDTASIPFGNTGLIDSQGDFAQKSVLARLGWDLSGEGIKIGVISDSYDRKAGVVVGNSSNVTTDINNGDLPGATNPVNVIQDYPFGPATDEGRAMLQIIHDVAPEAELNFRTGFISEGNMAAGIADLVNAGVDIIVDDVQYLKAPMFSDGIIAKAVNSASNLGVNYFATAGNFSDNSYEAIFNPYNNGVRHDFGSGPLQNLTMGVGTYIIVLQWDDDYYSLGENSGALYDLDIYLADDEGNITNGFNIDNEGKDPVEIMYFTVVNPTTSNIIIERIGGNNAPLKFKYVVFRAGEDGEFDAVPAANSSTIVGHAMAEGAITVGAVRYDNTPVFGGTLLAQNSSSLGGLEIDGIVRNKPNIMAPTGGDTSVDLGSPDFEGNNLPNFFGTSASAPHAAGIAALLLEAKTKFGVDPLNQNPDLSIRSLLQKNAIDMNTPEFDFKSGYGFVSATRSVGSFSNPTPGLISLNLDNLDLEQFQPGETEFDLIVEGEYFLVDSKVFLRDTELSTTYVDENTLIATVPVFTGNPTIKVYTGPNALTNGLDGGDSNTLTFFDPVIVDVTIKADDTSRRYGESNPDFTYTTKVGDTEDPLPQNLLDVLAPSVSLNTEADPTSFIGIYAIDVELPGEGNELPAINPDLLELYNFIIEPGVLNIDPMPVVIQPNPFNPITYGDPLPEITYQYIFGEQNEQNVQVDPAVLLNIQNNHQTAMATFNGISLVNGLSTIANGISLVNGEPTINGISLVNKSFFVSQGTIDKSDTIAQNGLSLVNGDDNGKLIQFGADLFDSTKISNGTYSSITNGISFVNGLSLVNGTAQLNGLSFVNGLSLVNGISYVNGLSLVNGISFVNGLSIVNGEVFGNSNDTPEQFSPFDKVFVILSDLDASLDPNIPVTTYPVNVITGIEVGTQYVIPGTYFDQNLIICANPAPLEITAADVIVQVDNKTINYGEQNIEFSTTITGLQFGDAEEDVFSEEFIYSPADGCTDTNVIEITNQYQPENYTVAYLPGELTINPVELTVTVTQDIFINEGESLPNNISYTADGLICGDTPPQFSSFLVDGIPYNTSIPAGQYSLTVNPDSISEGYDNYNINTEGATLLISPLVGCNDRVKASDLCKLPYNDPSNSELNTLLRFEYTNDLDVPIYIPHGNKNKLKKGPGIVIEGELPTIFYPGIHTFDIYTNGDNVQWEVITAKCKKPSKSPSGSNANPCTSSVVTSELRLAQPTTPENYDIKVYPNPVEGTLTVNLNDQLAPSKIRLLNSLGALLMERNLNGNSNDDIELDLSSITSGLIFVEIQTEEKVFYKRVIKK